MPDTVRVPSFVVEPLRNVLRDAGIDGAVVRHDGSFDLALLAANLLREVEIETRWTPTIKVDVKRQVVAQDDAGGVTTAVLQSLMPVVRLRTIGGSIEVAPYGHPAPGEGAARWQKVKLAGIAAGAGLAGLVVWLAVKSWKHPWQVLPERGEER